MTVILDNLCEPQTFSLDHAPLNTQITVWCDMWVVTRNKRLPYPKSTDYLGIYHDPDLAAIAKDKLTEGDNAGIIKARFVWLDNAWYRTYVKPESAINDLSPRYELSADVTVYIKPMRFWQKLVFLFTGRYDYRTVARPY